MQIKVHRVSSSNHFERAGLDEFLHRQEAEVFWVDVQGAAADELEEFLKPLQLHPLALEACLDPSLRGLVAPFEHSLVARVPYLEEVADVRVCVLAILCVQHAVVTIHKGEQQVLGQLAQRFTSERALLEPSASGILYHILDQHADRSMEFVLKTRDSVDDLEAQSELDSSDATELNRLSAALKRKTARVSATIEDQDRCARAIQSLESSFLSIRTLQAYMRDTVGGSDYALRVLERQGARLSEVRQELQMRLHDRADSRLRLLTIVSVIFLPLTLVTGIYGMNFRRMPELEWESGYPAAIAFMALIAGLLLYVFHRKGWLQ